MYGAVATKEPGDTTSLLGGDHGFESSLKLASVSIGLFQIFLFVIYGMTGSKVGIVASPTDFDAAYGLFLGVEIMMFIGFGYLMTFLKTYGVGAVAFTMLVTVVGMQWALFTEVFFAQSYSGVYSGYNFDMYSLIGALYAVAAVLISFGGVIGKLSPFQLLVMTIVELVFYSLNNQVFLVGNLGIADVGGTIIIHMFGAYFGLAVAYVVGNPNAAPAAGYVPDMFAFIGTLFLWVYWPSFVGGALPAGEEQQQRAIIATIISLASSTTIAFAFSSFLSHDGKFRPVDLQNATLAGGVAIGAVANLTLDPLVASTIGMIAGALSTFGFSRLQPFLEEKIGLFDSCGIHNLHGMPSVLGGLASVFLASYKQSSGRVSDEAVYVDHPVDQYYYQFCGIVVTIIFAVSTGIATGILLRVIEGGFNAPKFRDPAFIEKASD
jgi:ammonium transporter Rh